MDFTLKIVWLDSRLVVWVRWLGTFARDELPDLPLKSRPWIFIMNTDPTDQPGTHWLAYYAIIVGPIEFINSFGFSLMNYSLDSLNPLHLCFPFKSPITFVCGHYCIFYIYLSSRNKSLSECFYLFENISIATRVSHVIFINLKPFLHSQTVSPYWSMLSIKMSILLIKMK